MNPRFMDIVSRFDDADTRIHLSERDATWEGARSGPLSMLSALPVDGRKRKEAAQRERLQLVRQKGGAVIYRDGGAFGLEGLRRQDLDGTCKIQLRTFPSSLATAETLPGI